MATDKCKPENKYPPKPCPCPEIPGPPGIQGNAGLNGSTGATGVETAIFVSSPTTIEVNVNTLPNTPADNHFTNVSIEIRIYP